MTGLRLRRMLVLVLVCCVALFAGATKKRFSVEGVNTDAPAQVEATAELQSARAAVKEVGLWDRFANAQKQLREVITEKVSLMKSGDWSVIWAFLAVCFIYGILHALGPGHGKSIVVGYFLARKGGWRQGIALGTSITFIHTLSAVLLLVILYLVMRATIFPSFEFARENIEKASYALVMLTGVLLVAIAVRDLVRRFRRSEKRDRATPASWKEIMAVAAVTGVVPCPAVALIVLFCLLHSMVLLSLLGALFICIGMTVTNVSFGIAAVAMSKGIDKGAVRSGRFASDIHIAAALVGGILVFMSGLLLFVNVFSGRC